jgi:hypothetical protein
MDEAENIEMDKAAQEEAQLDGQAFDGQGMAVTRAVMTQHRTRRRFRRRRQSGRLRVCRRMTTVRRTTSLSTWTS